MAWEVGHPIKRDGTSQRQRHLNALLPENNPLDARTIEDGLVYAYRLAEKVTFFDPQNEEKGNWQAFFPGEDPEMIRRLLRERPRQEDRNIEPQQALFITFLKLLDLLRQDLNRLTQRHLNFYYEQVLGFERQAARPDQVHVLFELARQKTKERIEVGTVLLAGKDAAKQPLFYRVKHEVVVNATKVKTVKSVQGFPPYTGDETEHSVPAPKPFPPFGTSLFPKPHLLIGLENLPPDSQLSLFFQILEGSALRHEGLEQEDIAWSFWTVNGMVPIPSAQIIRDSTQNLQRAGIITFSFAGFHQPEPGPAFFGEGLYWIMARLINKNPENAPHWLDVQAQAAVAEFEGRGNAASHLEQPLAADTIKNLQARNPAIRKVRQPYESFGGTPPEKDASFFARVSERLRHKQRAITLWDYEHLILNAFEEIYRAKAVGHTGRSWEKIYSEFEPGAIEVVIIPKIKDVSLGNALQPMASNALLKKIKAYLENYQAPSAELRVSNARYEMLKLDCKVGFREGFDGGYYRQELNEAVKRHLSPWAYEEGADIAFGGRIYRSQLLAFVESLPYVDYVADFKLRHQNEGAGISEMTVDIDFSVRDVGGDAVEVAEPTTATSVLVSAEDHDIEVLQSGGTWCANSVLI